MNDIKHKKRRGKRRKRNFLKINGNKRVTVHVTGHRCNHCCHGKSISIQHYKFVCLYSCLSYPPHKTYVPYPCVASLAAPYFSTLSHKWHDFRKNVLNIKCVLWFYVQLLSKTLFILRRIQQDIIINVHKCPCKVPLCLSYFNENWIFLTHIPKNPLISDFMKSLSTSGLAVPCRQMYRQTWWSW